MNFVIAGSAGYLEMNSARPRVLFVCSSTVVKFSKGKWHGNLLVFFRDRI